MVGTVMIGKNVAHYRIVEKLGAGGMGVVYKAEDTKLKRPVALKFLTSDMTRDADAKQRFRNEALAASALQHNNICTIHDINETTDGQMFICMDYYAGETLKQRIARGPLKAKEAVNVAIQIGEGLAKAHDSGVLHRDIKPANVILTNDGIVKIVDFGLAKLAGGMGVTKTDTTLGTIAYMSPEQAKGQTLDQRSDIFSLGVVLYEMLSGQRPFRGEYDQAVIYAILNEDPEPITDLSPRIPEFLVQTVSKALEKDKEQRYGAAREVVDDLTAGTTSIKKDRTSAVRSMPPIAAGGIVKRQARSDREEPVGLQDRATHLVRRILRLPLPPENPTTVAVLPFENLSGDDGLSYLKKAIPNLLITNLEQSRHIRVLTWERLKDLLRSADRGDSDVLEMDQETAFELCGMDDVDGVVLGSFTKAGDIFATDIKVLDVQTKELLISASSRGEGPESILTDQIDRLSKAVSKIVRLKTGVSDTVTLRITDVTTQSLESYRLYLEGVGLYHGMQSVGARDLFEQAVSLDPAFAMAFYYLSKAERELGNHDASTAALEKAVLFSNESTVKEALYIQMDYARFVVEDREKSVQLNRELVKRFPKEKIAFHYLATKLSSDGKTSEAIEVQNQTIRLDPNFSHAYNHLGYCYARLGDYEKALMNMREFASLAGQIPNAFDSLAELLLLAGKLDEAAFNARRAQEIEPRWDGGRLKLGYIYALEEEYDECLNQYDKYSSPEEEPGIRLFGLRHHALVCFLLGRYRQALRLLHDQRSLASSVGNPLLTAEAHVLSAFVHAEANEISRAHDELRSALELVQSPAVSLKNQQRWSIVGRVVSGLLTVREGDLESANANSADLGSIRLLEEGEIQEIHSCLSAILTGEIALSAGSGIKAVQTLGAARSPDPYFYMLWPYPNMFINFFARDGLARAYHASGDLDQAIAEYERLVTFNPESTNRFLIHPRYHYRLGALYEERGWTGRALQEYEKFLAFWPQADDGLPELTDAKQRLTSLSSNVSS